MSEVQGVLIGMAVFFALIAIGGLWFVGNKNSQGEE